MDVTVTVQIDNGPYGAKPNRIRGTIKMELPLASWMEWVVTGGLVVFGGVALKVIDRIQK